MLLLLSVWKGEIQLTILNFSATLFALFGLSLVLNIYSGAGFSFYSPLGVALAFLAAIATFMRVYIYGKKSLAHSPLVIGAENFIVALGFLSFLVFWEGPILPETNLGFFMAFLASFSLVVGSFGFFYGVAILGAYRTSMIMKLEPIFATIFGVLLVYENLSMNQYFGILIVVLSLVSLELFNRQKQ